MQQPPVKAETCATTQETDAVPESTSCPSAVHTQCVVHLPPRGKDEFRNNPLGGLHDSSLELAVAKAEAWKENSTQAFVTARCPRHQVRTNANSASTRSLRHIQFIYRAVDTPVVVLLTTPTTRTCYWTAERRPLDARGHQGEVDEMAQGPCTMAFKAS